MSSKENEYETRGINGVTYPSQIQREVEMRAGVKDKDEGMYYFLCPDNHQMFRSVQTWFNHWTGTQQAIVSYPHSNNLLNNILEYFQYVQKHHIQYGMKL